MIKAVIPAGNGENSNKNSELDKKVYENGSENNEKNQEDSLTSGIAVESVEAEFSYWRANRRNRAEPIPSKLWSQVGALLPHYKHSIIARRLRMSHTQMKMLLAKHQKSDNDVSSYPFVTATPSLTSQETSQAEQTEVIIVGKSKKTITLKLTVHALQALLPRLVEHI